MKTLLGLKLNVQLNIHSLVFALFIFGQTNLTFASSCGTYLGSGDNTPEYLLMNYVLKTYSQDGPEVLNIPSEELSNYELGANKHGQLVFKSQPNSPLYIDHKERLLGVWSIEDRKPGFLYAIVEPTVLKTPIPKHSSFNQNQPVISAWSMKAKDGFITIIYDDSGHYKPQPLNMFFLVQELRELGLDLTSTTLNFVYGLYQIKGLKISALDYVNAIERLSPEEFYLLENLKAKNNFNFFLNLIYSNTDIAYTKNSILLYYLRNSSQVQPPLISVITKFLNDPETSKTQLIDSLKAMFHMSHSRFAGVAAIRQKTPEEQKAYYDKLKEQVLVLITDTERFEFISTWFDEYERFDKKSNPQASDSGKPKRWIKNFY